MQSKILELIKTNKNWEEILTSKNINMNKKGDLVIFNYGIEADFFDAYVCEARGIIIDIKALKVICWPFNKFGNWDCDYADVIDWASADIQEKVDGSIMKYYYYAGEWHWATNSMIDAADASTDIGNFETLIKAAKNYDQVAKEFTDPEYTYIFELTSPYNKIVVFYKEIELTMIGMRNIVTGQEETYRGSFKTPKRYPATNFDECIMLLSKMNKNSVVEDEGFVVVDKDYHRIKVKTEEYVAMHHAFNNGIGLSKRNIVKYVYYFPHILEYITRQFPEYQKLFDFYTKAALDALKQFDEDLAYGRQLRASCASQKEFALKIKDDPNKHIYFFAVNHPEGTSRDWLNIITRIYDTDQYQYGFFSVFDRFIPDFQP